MIMEEYNNKIRDFYEKYCKWIGDNPTLTSDIESMLKWSSCILTGKFSSSNLLSESVFSLFNLFVFFNDHAYSKVRGLPNADIAHPLKIYLTILEYIEVTLELTARNRLGRTGRWTTIFAIQLLKCVGRMILLRTFKFGLLPNPPIAPLLRDYKSEESAIIHENNRYRLTSGTEIRRVNEDINDFGLNSGASRLRPKDSFTNHIQVKWNNVKISAEVIYLIKPLVHLGVLSKYGHNSWKPWFTSLIMDLSSLIIYNFHPECQSLSREQQWQLVFRHLNMLYYLLRSPFYDLHFKSKLSKFFLLLEKMLPFLSIIIRPLRLYTEKWQQVYFLTWSH